MNEKEACGLCGDDFRAYNLVHLLSEGIETVTCLRCYNQRISNAADGVFEQFEFEPVILKDCIEKDHVFHFGIRSYQDKLVIDASEIENDQPSGYQFQIIGSTGDDPFEMFVKLMDRMRKALGRRHMEKCRNTGKWKIHDGHLVRGQIEFGAEGGDKDIPAVTIDGERLDWNEFGRMLMAHEGHHFRLDIFDKSEDVP